MTNLLLFLLCFLQDAEIPYKPKDEFEVKLNYEFKQRSEVNTNNNFTIDYSETVKEKEKKSGGPLPFLTLNIRLIKLPNGELKIKGLDHRGSMVLGKKVKEGDIVKLVLGFTDDLKDRVSSHEYNLYLVDGDKKEVNRIHIFVKPDGVFTINDEVRGKF